MSTGKSRRLMKLMKGKNDKTHVYVIDSHTGEKTAVTKGTLSNEIYRVKT